MAYLAGDIPVGSYNPDRLANIGIGHGAIDTPMIADLLATYLLRVSSPRQPDGT